MDGRANPLMDRNVVAVVLCYFCWCLCRIVSGFILILFKTLWFRFRLGSIEGWLFVYSGLVQDLFRVYLGFV